MNVSLADSVLQVSQEHAVDVPVYVVPSIDTAESAVFLQAHAINIQDENTQHTLEYSKTS